MRIGSLFSGYGGLDLAVEGLFPGSRTFWQCEREPAARVVLREHFGVHIYEDITQIRWSVVPRVDILTGGFPCQDVSPAGLRKGITADSRSGLWTHFAEGIDVLRPPLVIIENVRGLLSAKTDDPNIRAMGRVLADLSYIGYDARWKVLPAAAVGAPHRRDRVFIVAKPASDADNAGRP
jgi:DNA-cytosine methyltransferase